MVRRIRKIPQASLFRVAIAALVLSGCPKRFDPRADTITSSPDPSADNEYHEAKARLDGGNYREAETRFTAFLEKHPTDQLVSSAQIGEARAALKLGEAAKAKEVLEAVKLPAQSSDPVTEATRARVNFLLGLALHRTGDYQRSRNLLQPFSAQIAAGDDAVELHAVLADSSAHIGESELALREYSLFFESGKPAEREYVKDKVSDLVDHLPATEVDRLWQALPPHSVAVAFLGKRIAADKRAAGDLQGARAVLDASRGAREAAGLESEKKAKDVKLSRAIGCIFPLQGKGRALGERALRGALLAADLAPGQTLATGLPIELWVRDSKSDPARAADAVVELAKEGALAILGSPDRLESQAAAEQALALGIPFIELAPDDKRRDGTIVKLVRPRPPSAQALAKAAVAAGAKSVAILAPDSSYGRSMAEALAHAIRSEGAKVAVDLRYADSATSFVEPVKKIKAANVDALLIPAPASQLQLIAPQLASSGIQSMPNLKSTGPSVKLYATAEGMNDRFLESTQKYLEGAVLMPLYYSDPNEPRIAAFLERYRGAYKEEPSGLDALAFDAVKVLRQTIDQIAQEDLQRTPIWSGIAATHQIGITGEIGFGSGGERSGAPLLYKIEGGQLHPLK